MRLTSVWMRPTTFTKFGGLFGHSKKHYYHATFGVIFRVLHQNILFEKKNYKISLKTKLMFKIVRNIVIIDSNN